MQTKDTIYLIAQAIDAKCRQGDYFQTFKLAEEIISTTENTQTIEDFLHLLVATPCSNEAQFVVLLQAID